MPGAPASTKKDRLIIFPAFQSLFIQSSLVFPEFQRIVPLLKLHLVSQSIQSSAGALKGSSVPKDLVGMAAVQTRKKQRAQACGSPPPGGLLAQGLGLSFKEDGPPHVHLKPSSNMEMP